MNENTQNNATPAGNGGASEKMFTQDEVNRIVSDRLARERAKSEPVIDEREAALQEREKALKARETKYQCEDYLREISIGEKYRSDFLEVLDTSDFDKFKAAVDRLGAHFIVQTQAFGANVAKPPENTGGDVDQRIRDAFKPKI